MLAELIKKYRSILLIRTIGIFLILIIVVIFLILKVVPSGRETYIKDYNQTFSLGKGFVNNFTPVEEVDTAGDLPRIVGEPVYFSVFTPRTFSKVKMKINYRASDFNRLDEMKAGVLINPSTFFYDLKDLKDEAPYLKSAEFELKGTHRVNGKYIFAISIPGLKSDDERNDYIEVSKVTMEFSGRSLWQKILGLNK